MASSSSAKINAVPWPALVGASVLLHVGALGVGLPRMVQVSNPATPGIVDIPVALVSEESAPAQTTPVSLPSAVPKVPESSAESVPLGGQDGTVEPSQVDVRSQEALPPQPHQSQVDEPTQTKPSPEIIHETPRETVVDQPVPPGNQPAIDVGTKPQDEATSKSQNSSPGPTKVTILDDLHLPKDSGGDRIHEYPIPNFSMPLSLDIPSGHTCEGSLSTDVMNVGVAIDVNGFVSSLRVLQPDIYAQEADLTIADCLLSTVLAEPQTVTFTPAIRLTDIGKEEAVLTDRVQLRLRFTGD